MSELGGIVEYLYWPVRRTGRFIEDNNLVVPQLHLFSDGSFSAARGGHHG
jgi:hypothetical protein